MKRITGAFWLIFVLLPAVAYGQFDRHPRVQVGASGGVFRISLDRFDRHYGNRLAFPLGLQVGYAFSPSFLAMLRGRHFQKTSSEKNSLETSPVWQEDWLELGIQQYSLSFSGTSRTFFGFGLAFFWIQEKHGGVFLRSLGYEKSNVQPRGFYICGGFDYLIRERVTLSFEIELTSAGVEQGAGLEAQSVGGIFVNAGVNFLLF